MSITAVILTVDPSHLFERCMESVRRQTLQPSRIEVVRNVMPVAAALDEGLRRVQTEYFVLVDDDMVLNEDCFARLRALITENPKRADVVCMLMDPLVGKTGGIHIYRTRVLREIGFNAKNHTDELRWVEEQLS
jgi:GT2 family glycosyltransferase